MLVIYTPEGGDRREWEFDPDETWHWEAELIERVGRPMWVSFDDDFLALLRAGNFTARRALLWVMLRRDNPKLALADVAVKAKELGLGLDKGERRELRARLDSDEEFTAAQRAQAEEMLADYPDDEDESGGEPDVGKGEDGGSATDGP